ncbi:hypothetical protein Pcinc_011466 [Petrolisthes cinctipes]|uniref:PiggyBac transposable element-derived protein domain-containing protein n=1 Tax=Petrolisthes cinctipes TaxID=88211 RepID=A0AAE1G2S7_PETCI|nr:hypothetical protein Pcinc_013956 [Petrolisthes cinctipes]KAK3884255.1 hypothetical protein Pcinc_011466 [Petrolisthes cinctipes]
MASKRVKSLTIDEVLQILETDDNENQESKDENEEIRGKDIEEIEIFPPKDGAETDDDSDDDDTRNLNHPTAPQLVSECEIKVSVRETGKSENDNTKSGRQPRIRKKDRLWKANCELPQRSDSEQYVQEQGAPGDFMTPTECFELCFDKSLVKHLVDMSNRYALQKNHNLNVSENEMKVYIDQLRLGLGASVVLSFASHLPKDFKSYSIYFDNFFTGLPLLDELTKLGHKGTGTIRENRTEKCPLETTQVMKKKSRGTMNMRTSDNIAIVRWHDNSIVTLASNCNGCQPVTKVDRVGTVNKKRQKIKVDCPHVVTMYNQFMGGVDRFDQNVDDQRVSFRGKKWWYPLFALD